MKPSMSLSVRFCIVINSLIIHSPDLENLRIRVGAKQEGNNVAITTATYSQHVYLIYLFMFVLLFAGVLIVLLASILRVPTI
ncbi:hypothetical protein OS42_04960 [Dickeya oryzae]